MSEGLNCVAAEGDARVVFYDFGKASKADFPADIYAKLEAMVR